MDPGAYTALRWYNGSATLSFALDEEGKWIWADGPDFPPRCRPWTRPRSCTCSSCPRRWWPCQRPGSAPSPPPFEGSDNVTAAPLMQDLLHDLASMSVAKCVDYFPSEEAGRTCRRWGSASASPGCPPRCRPWTRPRSCTCSSCPRRWWPGGEDQPALWFEGSDNVTAAPLMQDLLHDLASIRVDAVGG